MPENFLGQIIMGAFPQGIRGFAACDGQKIGISQNAALYQLLKRTYGGDDETFNLPDLRGRTPVGAFPSKDPAWRPPAVPLGSAGGHERVKLAGTQIPAHSHAFRLADTLADSNQAQNGSFARSGEIYSPPADLVWLIEAELGDAGRGEGHENMQPFQVLPMLICLSGIFPTSADGEEAA